MHIVHEKKVKFTYDYNIDTSGVSIDPDLAKNYSDSIVKKALILKAQYKDKYSDGFYLDYAHRSNIIELNAKMSGQMIENAAACPIQDPKWAGYSYEEIIQMENNGYKIPKEVLLWAHAQQESDVTSYEVIATASESDDNSSTEKVTDDSDINSIQKKVREYIIKAEKAKNENTQKVEEFKAKQSEALSVKNKKESDYKDSIQKISTYTKEWENLDKKAKSGTLTSFEQERYFELSKLLQGKGGSPLKETQIDVKELNELLDSINSFDNFNQDNITLADETIKAGYDLANFDRNYNDTQAKHSISGIVFNGTGSLRDVLFGVNSSSMQKIASDTGRDLENATTNFSTQLTSEAILSIKEFAISYSLAAQNIENITPNKANNSTETQQTEPFQNTSSTPESQTTTATTDTSTTVSTESAEGENGQASKSIPKLYVCPALTAPWFVAAATLIALASLADAVTRNKKAEQAKKQLDNDAEKSNQDAAKLQEANEEAQNSHNSNMEKQDNYINRLESIQAQKVTVDNPGEITSEEDSIMQELTSIMSEDEANMDEIVKNKGRLNSSILKAQKTEKVLDAETIDLITRNENNQNVAKNTLICGELTTAVGMTNLVVSEILISTGLAFMSNVCTYILGFNMCIIGIREHIIATSQLILGPTAAATGTASLITSNSIENDIKNYNQTADTANEDINSNIKYMNETDDEFSQGEPASFDTVTDAAQNSTDNSNTISNSSIVSNIQAEPTQSGKEKYQENKQNLNNKLMSASKEAGSSTPVTNSYTGGDKENISEQSRKDALASNKQREETTAKKLSNEKNNIIDEMEQINIESSGIDLTTDKVEVILKNNLAKSKSLGEEFADLKSTVENINVESTNAIKPIQEEFDEAAEEVTGLIASGNRRLTQAFLLTPQTSVENQNISDDDAIDAALDVMTKADIAAVLENDPQEEDTNIVAAASSGANADINRTSVTDDKLDRKLARFNNDSIIESKKKQRRVNAILASSRGR